MNSNCKSVTRCAGRRKAPQHKTSRAGLGVGVLNVAVMNGVVGEASQQSRTGAKTERVAGFSWGTSVPDRGETCAKSLRLGFAWHVLGTTETPLWPERTEPSAEQWT